MRLLLACAALAAALAPAPGAPPRVFVDAGQVAGRTPEHLSGHFFEVMNDSVTGGIWAELLRDRSFEGPDAGGDGCPDAWQPAGQLQCAVDDATAVPWRPGGWDHSLRLNVQGSGELAQGGLALRRGEAYRLTLWWRRDGAEPAVSVSLRSAAGRVYATGKLEPSAVMPGTGLPPAWSATGWQPHRPGEWGRGYRLPAGWARYTCRLAPAVDDDNATLAIGLTGQGVIWLDKASLLPGSARAGFRADVVEAIRGLRPSVIRYPGGNFVQGHHWTDAIGPRDLRPNVPNWAWGNAPDANEMGTDEFMALCRLVGAQPMICVSVGDTGSRNTRPDNGTERAFAEALAQLEYCNGAPTTPWGRRRAANGSAAPYGVRYWEIGNELWGEWEIGHVDAWTYARRFQAFAQALRRQDPQIELFACGDAPEWHRALFEVAPAEVDWLVLHHYYRSGSFADCVAEPANYARTMDEAVAMAAALRPGKPVRISFNEWKTSFAPEMNHSLLAGMWAAAMVHEMMRRESVQMLNPSDLVNGWNGGLIQVHPRGLYLTPNYHVVAMEARLHGPLRVRANAAGPAFDSPSQGRGHPVLDVVATRGDGMLYVSVLNKSLAPITAELLLDNCRPAGPAVTSTLTAPAITAYNSIADPAAVAPREGRLALGPGGAECTFPGPSLTIIAVPITAVQASRPGALEGQTDCPGATIQAQTAGQARPQVTSADGQGRYRLPLAAGLWHVRASADDRAGSPTETVAIHSGRVTRLDLALPRLEAGQGILADFASALPDWGELTWLEGSAQGSHRLAAGHLVLQGGPASRYGLLSRPLPWSDRQATVVEAKVTGYTGKNALLTVTGGRGAGDFSHFCEVGLEDGRAQVWASGHSLTGRQLDAPATLRLLIGPPRADGGRSVEFAVNGEVVQRIPAYHELGAGPLRVFIYGWADSETRWDWLRAAPAAATEVTGVVRDLAGRPLPGVTVEALGIGQARTDQAGAYCLTGLPAGPVRLRAGGERWGYAQADRQLSAGPTTVDFQLSAVPAGAELFERFANLDRWAVRPLGNAQAAAEPGEGGLRLRSETGSAVLVQGPAVPGSAAAETTFRVLVTEFVGEAVTLHVGNLGWALRDGSLEARAGDRLWWPAECPLAVPCDLTLVVTAPNPRGRRTARFYYNGELQHTFEDVQPAAAGQDLTVALGGGNCRATFGWLAAQVDR